MVDRRKQEKSFLLQQPQFNNIQSCFWSPLWATASHWATYGVSTACADHKLLHVFHVPHSSPETGLSGSRTKTRDMDSPMLAQFFRVEGWSVFYRWFLSSILIIKVRSLSFQPSCYALYCTAINIYLNNEGTHQQINQLRKRLKIFSQSVNAIKKVRSRNDRGTCSSWYQGYQHSITGMDNATGHGSTD